MNELDDNAVDWYLMKGIQIVVLQSYYWMSIGYITVYLMILLGLAWFKEKYSGNNGLYLRIHFGGPIVR